MIPRRASLAAALLATAFIANACGGGQMTGPTSAPATPRASFAPTPAADPSSRISTPPLPGGRLVYVHLDGEGIPSLFTSNPDGSDTKPLLPPDTGAGPRWSPSGRDISVQSDSPQGLLFASLIGPDGTRRVQFESPDATLELGCFAWSPDGLRLACEGFDGADVTRNGIYTVRASDGRDLVRVTTSPDGGHDMPSDYSPDGNQIVFTRQRQPDDAHTTLMVVNVDGSGARAMSDRRLGGGRWSPDGMTILSDLGEEGASLLLVPVNGGEIRPIQIISDSLRSAFAGSWSPDGDWIVFSGRATKSVDLYIVRLDGTNLHQVTNTPMGQWEDGADWTASAP